MKKTRFFKSLTLFACTVLIAATALLTSGCGDSKTASEGTSSTITGSVSQNAAKVLGEGETKFGFTVTDADGKENSFEIHTDKKTVGDALSELNLIAGDQGEYGLYVKTVNGITVDYDKDGKYWAFYVNGEYASAGVDATDITEGATYAFKVE